MHEIIADICAIIGAIVSIVNVVIALVIKKKADSISVELKNTQNIINKYSNQQVSTKSTHVINYGNAQDIIGRDKNECNY